LREMKWKKSLWQENKERGWEEEKKTGVAKIRNLLNEIETKMGRIASETRPREDPRGGEILITGLEWGTRTKRKKVNRQTSLLANRGEGYRERENKKHVRPALGFTRLGGRSGDGFHCVQKSVEEI